MKRALLWWVLNGGVAALFYFGYFEGVGGARNVFLFAVWFNFAVTLCVFSDTVAKAVYAKGRSVPTWLSGAYDAAMIVTLIWMGLWFTGTAYVVTTLLQIGVFDRGKKEKWPTSEATA